MNCGKSEERTHPSNKKGYRFHGIKSDIRFLFIPFLRIPYSNYRILSSCIQMPVQSIRTRQNHERNKCDRDVVNTENVGERENDKFRTYAPSRLNARYVPPGWSCAILSKTLSDILLCRKVGERLDVGRMSGSRNG